MIKYIFFLVTILLFSGCATRIQVQSIKPANVDLNNVKNVSVLDFKNDNKNLSGNIEHSLNNININGEKYFNVVDRKNISNILNEQKLQSSGLVNDKTTVEIGNITGIQALIVGEVSRPTRGVKNYKTSRKECKKDKDGKKHCYQVIKYCTKVYSNINLYVKVLSTNDATVLFSKKYDNGYSNTSCGRNYNYRPDYASIERNSYNSAIDNFIYQITPHVYYRSIEVIEDLEEDYSDEAEKILENSITYLERKRTDKAIQLTKKLIDLTNEKSFVPFYNLAIIYESKGKLSEALRMINIADNLSVEPNKLIDNSIYRIKKEIQNENNIKDTMNKKKGQ